MRSHAVRHGLTERIKGPSLILGLAAVLSVLAGAVDVAGQGSYVEENSTEVVFSERAGEALEVIGYDLFGFAPIGGSRPTDAIPLGAVAGNYRLGPGDRLSVTILDDPVRTHETVVDPAGRLILPGLPPVDIAGASLDEAVGLIAGLAGERMPGTRVDLALVEAREIDVLVVGSVGRPGRVRLPAFASVLDAIFAAGGVRQGGSLRAIRHIRADGSGAEVDLFDLLGSGIANADAPVRAGDRIVVPPFGPATAVSGAVARPGIYELPPGEPGMAVEDAIALAGGFVAGAEPRLARLTFKEGRDRVVPASPGDVMSAGDILLAGRVDGGSSAILLEGHVASPGPRAIADTPTLAALLSGDGAPKPDAYRPFAILSRIDPAAGGRRLEAFDLDDADGLAAILLEPGDRVGILGPEELAFLTSDLVLEVLSGGRSQSSCPAIEILARTLSGRLAEARWIAPDAASLLTGTPMDCPALFEVEPDWLAFAVARSALVAGDADRPGLYPVAGATAIGRSGAATGEAPILRPGEVAVLSRPSVMLLGHVHVPGRRAVETTPTLSALIASDGGGRDGVYPMLGVVARRNGPGSHEEPFGFVPRQLLAGAVDVELLAGDAVYLLSNEDAMALAALGSVDSAGDFPSEVRRFVAERVVTLSGAVRRPGSYPIGDAETLDQLFEAAGGIGSDADLLSIELVGTRRGQPFSQSIALDRTPAAMVPLVAGDAVNVPTRAGTAAPGEIVLSGEFQRPGRYALRRGDRLSDLIERAGSFTAEAYPAGLVLARSTVATREKENNLAEAAALEAQIQAELETENPPPAALVAEARDAARRLAELKPVGRITVAIAPDGAIDPDADPYLEPGDTVTVPRRPAWVAVTGEVQAPGRFAHRRNGTVDDYVDLAGGTTAKADHGRIILVGPGGEAEPRSSGLFGGFAGTAPQPGSVVVVPTRTEGRDALELVETVTRIVGQIAVTAATIAILAP